ncbi:hypothetical protein GCM10010236_80680 [Streptomyces eurythermus]|nr:hypothetical protein GCM10010236_80680 [Streptomyces eurythermus]
MSSYKTAEGEAGQHDGVGQDWGGVPELGAAAAGRTCFPLGRRAIQQHVDEMDVPLALTHLFGGFGGAGRRICGRVGADTLPWAHPGGFGVGCGRA